MRGSAASAVLLGFTLSWCAGAAGAGAGGALKVKPRSGSYGTRFAVTFAAPRAEPTRGYHVVLRAVNTDEGNCVASLDFYNPRRVVARAPLTFSFTPRAGDELCTGPWKVSVHAGRSGVTLLAGARFTFR